MDIVTEIEVWIDKLLVSYQSSSLPCSQLPESICQFFPQDFLRNTYFVETDDIPKPYFAEGIPGASSFLAMPAQGITYKNTYFLLPGSSKSTHLHELVHVAQWLHLGARAFILAYIAGVQANGYRESPLEEMAYGIQAQFEGGCPAFDIPDKVRQSLLSLPPLPLS